eukprot:2288249-Pyramimonas_sp.AAC.1
MHVWSTGEHIDIDILGEMAINIQGDMKIYNRGQTMAQQEERHQLEQLEGHLSNLPPRHEQQTPQPGTAAYLHELAALEFG